MSAFTTPRLLLGPIVIAIGSILLSAGTLILAQLGPGGSGIGSALGGLILAAVLAGLLLAWRAGQGWARWAAWGVAVLLMALSLVFVFVGVWGAGFYDSPTADLPMLIGLPIVGVIGAGLVIWAVLRGGTRVPR